MAESDPQENKVHPTETLADAELLTRTGEQASVRPPVLEGQVAAADGHRIPATITLVLPPAPEPISSSRLNVRHVEAFVSLMKVIIWPLVILFFFWMLYAPLIRMIGILPDKLLASTKVSVGSLSFEIQQSARAAGSPELAQLISGLSPLAIEQLLNTARSRQQLAGRGGEPQSYTMPSAVEMGAVRELEKKGLLQFERPPDEFDRFLKSLPLDEDNVIGGERIWYRARRPLTSSEETELTDQVYYLTESGKRVFDLIIAAVSQELQQPPSSKVEP